MIDVEIKSPIRWVGSKRWLARRLANEIVEANPSRFIELFVGGGSVALAIPSYIPKLLNDSNPTLMDFWRCVRDAPNALMDELDRIEKQYPNTNEGYLKAREELNSMILVHRERWLRRAAMLLYINARCFNGLWRTNATGYYNVPYGKIESPSTIDREEAMLLSRRLRGDHIMSADYRTVIMMSALKGAAVYADPPYDGTFDSYTKDAFGEAGQRELAEQLRWCTTRGAKIWASNADTPFVRDIYGWAKVEEIGEWHGVGATGARRGTKSCLLIRAG